MTGEVQSHAADAVVLATGGYGNVMWFTASPDIQTLEAGEAAVNTDADFLAMVDRAGTAYAPGASQTLYRKVV